jgi:polyferredoxin
MRSKQIEVRGCCMGIPFGCGSILLVALAGVFVQYQPSITLLLTTAGAAITAVVIAAAALIITEWFLEQRNERSTN